MKECELSDDTSPSYGAESSAPVSRTGVGVKKLFPGLGWSSGEIIKNNYSTSKEETSNVEFEDGEGET